MILFKLMGFMLHFDENKKKNIFFKYSLEMKIVYEFIKEIKNRIGLHRINSYYDFILLFCNAIRAFFFLFEVRQTFILIRFFFFFYSLLQVVFRRDGNGNLPIYDEFYFRYFFVFSLKKKSWINSVEMSSITSFNKFLSSMTLTMI